MDYNDETTTKSWMSRLMDATEECGGASIWSEEGIPYWGETNPTDAE